MQKNLVKDVNEGHKKDSGTSKPTAKIPNNSMKSPKISNGKPQLRDVLDSKNLSKNLEKNASANTKKIVDAAIPMEDKGGGSAEVIVGVETLETDFQAEWIEAKGNILASKKNPSHKKNPFLMLSDFPYKSKSRFPVDRRKEVAGDISTSKNRFQLEELEGENGGEEEKSRKKDRELHKLQWDGNPSYSDANENLSRGCRSHVKKKK